MFSSKIPRSTSRHSSSSSSKPGPLHNDILYLVRDQLVDQKAFKSLANLSRCSVAFKKIFAPALKGWQITLQGQPAREIFHDIVGVNSSAPPSHTRSQSAPARTHNIGQSSRDSKNRFDPYIRAPFSRSSAPLQPLEPWQVGASPNRMKAQLHHRRLRALQRCESLTILDFTGAETLIEAVIAAGDDERAFRSINSLCFGSDSLWRLAEGSDMTDAIVEHLKERLRPRHVCFTLSIGDKQKTMERLERIGRLPAPGPPGDDNDPWSKHYVHSSRIIQALCEAWAPETITIHGMTAENIPAVYSSRTTIFFGPRPSILARIDPLFYRADVRAEEIANGVVMIDEDQSAIFVGLEEFAWRRGLREEELGKVSVEDRMWQQINQPHVMEEARNRVKFVTYEEAAKCGCCGKQ